MCLSQRLRALSPKLLHRIHIVARARYFTKLQRDPRPVEYHYPAVMSKRGWLKTDDKNPLFIASRQV